MALTPNKVRIKLSDVILHENDSSTAVTRDKANVTPPVSGKYKCGTLVCRAKATPAFNNTETATFTFEDVTASGENATITIAGRVITIADGSSATAAQIAQAFVTGVTVGSAAVSGTLAGYTIVAGETAAEAVFTSATPNTNVTDLTAAVAGDAGALTPVISQGVAGNQTYALAASADLVITNEFAILIGDHFSYESEIELLPVQEGKLNAVVLARGNAILASWVIEEVGKQNGLVALDFPKVFALLANQGILVEKTYGVAPSV